MRNHSHLGTMFKVWNGRSTWFWRLAVIDHNGGTIGAATTEMQAIGEARALIEESRSQAHDSVAGFLTVAVRRGQRVRPTDALTTGAWKRSFTRLARHLAQSARA
ncbi:MAG: hypothetical protein ACREQX_00690 [Candidatus Binataceae bacterium]